jgi:hypothetical protein
MIGDWPTYDDRAGRELATIPSFVNQSELVRFRKVE